MVPWKWLRKRIAAKTIRELKKKGFEVEIVGEEKFFFEKLSVLKARETRG